MLERCNKKPNYIYNWAARIREILYKYGFQDVWLNQGVNNVDLFLHEFKDRVKCCFHSEMNAFLRIHQNVFYTNIYMNQICYNFI